MPTKVWKDGNRCTITEFDVREIDRHGDVQDVNSFETEAEAMRAARGLFGKVPAVVVEKCVRRFPAHRFAKHVEYTTVYTGGDFAALKAGGWQ